MNYRNLRNSISVIIVLTIIPFISLNAKESKDSTKTYDHFAVLQECAEQFPNVDGCIMKKWDAMLVDAVMSSYSIIGLLNEKVPEYERTIMLYNVYYDDFERNSEPYKKYHRYQSAVRNTVKLLVSTKSPDFYALSGQCETETKSKLKELGLKPEEEQQEFLRLYSDCMDDKFEAEVGSITSTAYACFSEKTADEMLAEISNLKAKKSDSNLIIENYIKIKDEYNINIEENLNKEIYFINNKEIYNKKPTSTFTTHF